MKRPAAQSIAATLIAALVFPPSHVAVAQNSGPVSINARPPTAAELRIAANDLYMAAKKLKDSVDEVGARFGHNEREALRAQLLTRIMTSRYALNNDRPEEALRDVVVPALSDRFQQVLGYDEARLLFARAAQRLGYPRLARTTANEVLNDPRARIFHAEAASVVVATGAELGDVAGAGTVVAKLPPDALQGETQDEILLGLRFQYARNLILARHYKEAMPFLENIPPESPWGPQARYAMAVVYVQQGQLDAAAAIFQTLADWREFNPKLPPGVRRRIAIEANLAFGRTWLELGNPRKAYKGYSLIPPDSPLFRRAVAESVEVFIRARRFEDATTALEGYRQLLPAYLRGPWIHVMPAEILQRAGKYDEANERFTAVRDFAENLRSTLAAAELLAAYEKIYAQVAAEGPDSVKEMPEGLALVPGIRDAFAPAEHAYALKLAAADIKRSRLDLEQVVTIAAKPGFDFPDVRVSAEYAEKFAFDLTAIRTAIGEVRSGARPSHDLVKKKTKPAKKKTKKKSKQTKPKKQAKKKKTASRLDDAPLAGTLVAAANDGLLLAQADDGGVQVIKAQKKAAPKKKTDAKKTKKKKTVAKKRPPPRKKKQAAPRRTNFPTDRALTMAEELLRDAEPLISTLRDSVAARREKNREEFDRIVNEERANLDGYESEIAQLIDDCRQEGERIARAGIAQYDSALTDLVHRAELGMVESYWYAKENAGVRLTETVQERQRVLADLHEKFDSEKDWMVLIEPPATATSAAAGLKGIKLDTPGVDLRGLRPDLEESEEEQKQPGAKPSRRPPGLNLR